MRTSLEFESHWGEAVWPGQATGRVLLPHQTPMIHGYTNVPEPGPGGPLEARQQPPGISLILPERALYGGSNSEMTTNTHSSHPSAAV